MQIKATRTLILSRPAVSLALTLALILICGAVLLSVFSTRGLTAASQRVNHTQQTLVAVSQLLATISEAETGQRGFILTGDRKYLRPYEAARARLPGELARLRHQYADGQPGQIALFDRLEVLVQAKLQELARTLTLLREDGISSALELVSSDEGWRIMNEIRQLLQSIQTREVGELERQASTATQRAQDFQMLNFGLVALAVVLAGAEAWLLIRRVHELEGLITVCAWTRKVEWQGRWFTFEEYFNRRFNLRFTHGICEEAAQQMRADAKALPVPQLTAPREGPDSR